ncbi:hypothetical protein PHLCEN_2v4807 [Hermanssonia centrifuga]|uniref:Cytochrome P450 n=1 Tax=Hermanssonia centrifuga TaxID=98765 RepID=A0A2R6PG91_9APHY|nr:hypothetical protein PHLCEN_2v4807 [Hermanssonia centrifuga]
MASFPGPLLNKLTTLTLLHTVSTGKRHLIIEALHKKYGVFVRTGPNTLSINSLEAVGPIYSSAQCFNRSEGYRPGRFGDNSLFFIRDRQRHNIRRRVWAGAFTPAMIKNHDDVLNERMRQLVACILRRQDNLGVVDLSECFRHWAFDVMGDLTFGEASDIELMRNGDPEGIIAGAQKAMMQFEILGEVPPLFDIGYYLPASKDLHYLETLAARFLVNRKKSASKSDTDLSSFLLGYHDEEQKEALRDEDLNMDAVFAIEAGADTPAGVLTLLFYHLLSDRTVYNHLKEELDTTFSIGEIGPEDHASLLDLPYLSAVVQEGLRLSTPFPGLARVVPKDGVVLVNRYIPGGTIVSVPAYAQEVSPENFWPAPLEFRPERWLEGGLGPDSILRPGALVCFSFGPFGCLGRQLAMRELHLAVAQLVLSYDITLAPAFNEELFMDGVRNIKTTLFKFPLLVQATVRKTI